MTYRPPLTLVVAIAAVTIAGCSGQSTSYPQRPLAPPPRPGGTVFGFNEDGGRRSFELQAKMGMPIRRFKVPWSAVEPAPGKWDWARYDAQYRQMTARGLEPLLNAIGSPCWTRPGQPCSPGVPDPEFDSDWAEYVRRLVARYPAAVGVEVWNEPNIVPLFPPRPDPVRFTELLHAAYDAVKTEDPQLPVVSGGLFRSDRTGPYGIADGAFLAAMYRAGAGQWMDAIGAHPYPIVGGEARWDVAGMRQSLDRLRAARNAAGASKTPIWITEMGVSTTSARGYPRGATEAQQARDLVQMARIARRADDVPVALFHKLIDVRPSAGGSPLARVQMGFGVFRADGRPKPAACDLSQALAGSLTC